MPDTIAAPPKAMALVARLENAGFRRVEPPLLIAADLVRDLVGEAMARRLYLTSDADGRELCLRPDYTIPVVEAQLAGDAPLAEARLSYLGPVFRYRPGETGEFRQAGIEWLGVRDAQGAEAEVVMRALDGARLFTDAPLSVAMGDVGIVLAALDALDLAPVWHRRLLRGFRRNGLQTLPASTVEDLPAGLIAALASAEPKVARALVTDLLSIAGLETVGGRSTADIAERFLDQAALGAGGLPPAKAEALEAILGVEGDPESAHRQLAVIADLHGIDLAAPLAALERRNRLLAGHGVDLAAVRFSPRFGRDVDYYTGLVFEIGHAGEPGARRLVGGGRYDRLTEMMAAKRGLAGALPAVGCAFWIEGLLALGGATP